jgi:2-polyprenyl-6-methoxyphenol hydroxylase-like FAD-dependent oxidoreductase
MPAIRNALIVGGGPAGLSTATVLSKRGIDAEIVEINDELRPLGSGLTMVGPTLRALRQVDEETLERCIREGVGHDALGFGTVEGDVVERVVLPKVAGPEYPAGFGIMRPLFWGMLAEMAERAGARVRLSTTVAAIEQGDGLAHVELTDGTGGTYDLVIGADGLHSKIRELVFPDAPEPFLTGQTVWRAVVPRPTGLSDDMSMYYGPRVKAGCNPVSKDEMYIFVVENTPEQSRPSRREWPALIQGLLTEYEGVIGWARERMTDPERIDRRPLQAILLPSPWYRGRVLLIGDAAHATTPHLAMGAGIAIEDAVVLGEVLEREESLERALTAFMERRYERCRLVVENSLQLGEWEKRPDDPEADPAGLSNESFAALAAPF